MSVVEGKSFTRDDHDRAQFVGDAMADQVIE